MSAPKPLIAGEKAPAFTFTENGKTIRSEELSTPHLVDFYPKDDTPGCTKEACGIRDVWSEFESAGLKVIGVSKDNEKSHDKFREKYSLPFPLIADAEMKLANCRQKNKKLLCYPMEIEHSRNQGWWMNPKDRT